MLYHSLLDLVLLLLLGSLLLHDLLVQVVHLLLVLLSEGLDASLVLRSLDRYDLLLMLDSSFRLLMLDLLDPLSPRILQELAHYRLDVLTLRLQSLEELLFIL